MNILKLLLLASLLNCVLFDTVKDIAKKINNSEFVLVDTSSDIPIGSKFTAKDFPESEKVLFYTNSGTISLAYSKSINVYGNLYEVEMSKEFYVFRKISD